MAALEKDLESIAQDTGFSGVVRIDRAGDAEFAKAYGLAHRGYGVPNTVDTRFAIASGAKGFTALVVMDLVERGMLSLSTTARSVLGDRLPLIDDAVTVEQLLAHRSGIGDYVDEEADFEITDYILPSPVHRLDSVERYLEVLDGFPAKFPPGARFEYCNSGYAVLALIAERVAGESFYDLVRERVCQPAGMRDTEFLRSDALPGRTATGYLSGDITSRTNVLHLPVRGTGDGGLYTTAEDVSAFWRALFAGRILPTARVAEMVRPRSDVPAESLRYGLGFWLHETSDVVILVGYDAGVSFRSWHDPASSFTVTVISNTSDGVWPLSRRVDEELSS